MTAPHCPHPRHRLLLSFMVLLGTFRLAKSVSFQEAGRPESERNSCTSFHHSPACHCWTMEEAGGTEELRLGVLEYGPDEHERQHRFWEVCSSGK